MHIEKGHSGILNTMNRTLAVFLFLAVLSFGARSLLAQSGGVGTELSMTITPEHPRPGEAVTVSVESYNIDLNRAEVRWFQNDKLVKAGVGEKKLEAVVGQGGELTSFRVVALREDGGIYSTEARLRPAEVNLLWQAQSYTPPFYRGKALMPYQGTVLVAAIPSFARGESMLPPESLIYTWHEGDDVIGDSSGRGKNLFVFRGSVPLRTKTISVTVESADQSMVASASIDVAPVAPRLLFYEEHPRFGILYGKALIQNFTFGGDETRISSIPYYFETDSKTGNDLSYDWEVNYAPMPSEKRSSLLLRRTTESSGRSNLFLEARSTDPEKSFQAAEERLMITLPERPFGVPVGSVTP